jgi:hypothetical protein
MEETHRSEELTLVELEAQHIELLPDRVEMYLEDGGTLFSNNIAIAVAVNGSAATANAGTFSVFAVEG